MDFKFINKELLAIESGIHSFLSFLLFSLDLNLRNNE